MTDLSAQQLNKFSYNLIPRFENLFDGYATMKDKEERINYYIRSIHDIAATAYKSTPCTADMEGVNWYHVYRLLIFKNYFFAAELIVYK